jgi:hypothetical protein
MSELADEWNLGTVNSAQVFEELARGTGMTVQAVEDHARRCCQQIVFHQTAWAVARSPFLPQALVTVNADLFEPMVVDAHGLRSVLDVVVMSFAEGTVNKSALCDIALERIGYRGPRSQALLIDNRRDLVAGRQKVGGTGYWFMSDEHSRRICPACWRVLG